MAILPHVQILRLHVAVVEARLTDSRTILLAGVAPAFVDSLPTAPDPSSQILSDLHSLNSVECFPDSAVPLALWLENAIALCGARKEIAVFYEASQNLRNLKTGPQERPAHESVVAIRSEQRRVSQMQLRNALIGLATASLLPISLTIMILNEPIKGSSTPSLELSASSDPKHRPSLLPQPLLGVVLAQHTPTMPLQVSAKIEQTMSQCVDVRVDDATARRFVDHIALDIRLRNPDQKVANITRARIDLQPCGGPTKSVFDAPLNLGGTGFLPSSAAYVVPADKLNDGKEYIPVSHVLKGDSVDRFTVKVFGMSIKKQLDCFRVTIRFNGICQCGSALYKFSPSSKP